METISCRVAADLIRKSGGKLFSVQFRKRRDGSLRRMTARTGVRKGVTGEGQTFNPADHDLLTVHEFVTDPARERGRVRNLETQWRSVPIEGIQTLKLGGKTFEVI
jgi:hypothetical protein